MKKRSLVSLSLTALLAGALPPAASAQTAAAAPTPPTPLLWKISDADNAVYLLGSFHILKPTDYPPSKDVEDAFSDAESLMLEVDLAEAASPDFAAKAQQIGAIADGKTLADILPEATWERLKLMMQVSGTPIEQVEHVDPWALESGMVAGMAQAAGFSQEIGLDVYFINRAKKANKPLTGLETLDEQLAIMDAMPYSEQAYSLGEILNNPQQAMLELNELHAAWREGDVETLDSKMRADMEKETPESYRSLIVERNDAWIPKIVQRLDGVSADDTLVVVGALHVLGSDGLIEKLRAKGYSFERVCSACAVE
jgi:uncharacterized protein YbaP (TraB family)